MPYRIRPARVDDAAELLAIYAPFVTDTTVSFEVEVPSEDEFRARIERGLASFAYLVAVDEETGKAAGYAYYGPFRSRPAYRWSVELSIYLAPEHRGNGLGGILLDELERRMEAQGVHASIACITSDNKASIAFHEKHGYRVCGTHAACGYKLGRWLDITWMQKQIIPCDAEPAPLVAPAPHVS